MKSSGFAERVLEWQGLHGRHGLPWQGRRDAYRIWLSEVMLQQTQVATVIPYYERFLAHFPDVAALAAAPAETVMSLWAGLGYYSRARNLHACAKLVVERHGGRFPQTQAELAELPGIGRSTAAAIAAFAFGERAAILDGNVKRVFARHFGIAGWPGAGPVEKALWLRASQELPERGIEAYTQGLMDLGALICTRSRPRCPTCPVAASCVALREDRIAELPSPRPPKARPIRHLTVAILLDADKVWIEPRGARGIWGGLYSLPEFAADLDEAGFSEAVRREFGLVTRSHRALTELTHDFTHYRLVMQPWFARVEAGTLAQARGKWMALSEVEGAALPAPIKRLLASLA